MRFIERPFCERLGTPFEQDLGEGLLSPQAMADPPVFSRARASLVSRTAPRAVLRIGSNIDRAELARPIARWMARAGAELLTDADLLVPVPLHPLRLWRRKFNQAAAFGREISRATGVRHDPGALRRVKATKSQVGLSRIQRAENVQGPLVSEGVDLKGRKIVLVDDVLTSGATLNAASRVPVRAGAGKVDALVFARVVTGA